MTFNPLINTPSANLINIFDNTVVTGAVTVDGFYTNQKSFNVSGNAKIGNSSLDTLAINSNIILNNGLAITPVSTAYDVSFNGTNLYIDSSTRNVGINTNTPSSDLFVNGTTLITGDTTINNSVYIDSTNKRVGINTSPSVLNYSLAVSGDVKFGTNSAFFNQSSTLRVGINTSTPSTKLHILKPGGTVANKIVDPNTLLLLEGTGKIVAQICSRTGSTNSDYAGMIFTAATVSSSVGSNRHISIFANWDAGATAMTTPGMPADGGPTANDLTFTYKETNSTTPFFTSLNGAFAYLRENVVVGAIYFTGQHRSRPAIEELEFYQDKIGLIVSSHGTYCETLDPYDNETTISINEAIPKVLLSTIRNDKTVFGVISDKEDLGENREYAVGRFGSIYKKKQDDHRLIINCVGEGGIWVCNINGNLENGDYITSCEIPGYGMKQDTELLMNYTVAKITCDCSFDLNSNVYTCEEFEFSGSTYRKAFVGCTYHCG